MTIKQVKKLTVIYVFRWYPSKMGYQMYHFTVNSVYTFLLRFTFRGRTQEPI